MEKQSGFGEKVRRLRLEKGLGLRELAAKAKLSHPYLSQVERGTQPPPADDKVKRLARALGCDADELLSLAMVGTLWHRFKEATQDWPESAWELLEPAKPWSRDRAPDRGSWLLQLFRAKSRPGGQMDKVLETLRKELIAGLQHGEFEFTVSGERTKGGKHRVRVKAGRVHRFEVPEAEVAGTAK